MDGIFSHAEQPAPRDAGHDESPPPAITETVTVPVGSDQAFEGFTEYIHLWWPVGKYSRFGSGTQPVFESGQLYEESEDGEQYRWGTVVEAIPAERLVLAFTLGLDGQPPTRVLLEFREEAVGSCQVVLVHDGWADGPAGREQFGHYTGWPEILGFYARFMGASLPS
ncbi:SRPBCC family protein [Arthrobacter halodurans]|uniref:Activator of Hsp90 ATPase homolog 1-like protein n=1 Tax=Arthrobacter halodurans TaxID=516699 RepID=A0ABV4UPS3_9MICC